MSTTPPKTPRKEIFSLNIGFANLPNQVLRKFLKKGFNFTFMVVGESRLGKSTLINSLFQADFYEATNSPGLIIETPPKTVNLKTSKIDIEEDHVKLCLTLVDTPGFGNYIDNSDNFNEILNYIDNQHEKYFNDENSLNRHNIVDTRVHCCFYFISPFGHGLKPLDIEAMKILNSKVNIVPVIGKADSLTDKEKLRLKQQILQELRDNDIKIYPGDICDDDDESEEYKEIITHLKAAIPFAVCGANTLLEVKGNFVWGRVYPWGVINIENPDHCDFIHLRTMLITHLQDLKDITQEIYYERYRFERLNKGLAINVNRKEFTGNFGTSKDSEWNKTTQ